MSTAVFEPFSGRNGGKLGFWAADVPFWALQDLNPVLARNKRAEDPFKVPCCGSSPIVVVWPYILDYDLGARTYGVSGHRF